MTRLPFALVALASVSVVTGAAPGVVATSGDPTSGDPTSGARAAGRPTAGATPGSDGIDFAREVRPILSDNCFHCHGPDPETRRAGLRLDTPEGALAALKSGGHAVVPGNTEDSELIYRIAPLSEDEIMPPADSGKSLDAAEIRTLTRWIEQGAVWEDHWSFRPPTLPAPPAVDGYLTADPIDAFVAEKLQAAGLDLQPEADPYTLLRRVTLDLTGLPPSADERAAFLTDCDLTDIDTAYAAAVDRLLASPRYGVHMARTWLDAARYADTHGLHLDNRRSMWPYRDWVVSALNENKPFDEFTVEQLAGDLLPDATLDQQIASGFNRCNPTSAEGGMIAEEYLSIYAKDRADTTATVWLGLTLGCAQCHDHKFDPLSQRDYYGMYAFFNSIDEEASDRNIENPRPFVRALDAAASSELETLRSRSAELEAQLSAANPELEARAAAWIQEQRDELLQHWSVLSPARAEATGGAELVIDSVSGEIVAQGPNPDVPQYELEFEIPSGAVDGIRLDALAPPGETLPGRGDNKNFVLSYLEVESQPLDGSEPFRPVTIREAVATHSQTGWPVASLLDPSLKNGWAGLGLDGDRSALLLPAVAVGYPSGTRLRLRMHFSDVHVRHSLARFRLAFSTRGDAGGAPGLGIWWRAHFEAESAEGLYVRPFLPREAIASGLDVLGEAAPGVAWMPEPRLTADSLHALEPGIGVHYLVLRMFAREERAYQLRLGSDDGLMVWLRGELIHQNRTPRAVALDQDLVPITLVPGQNELVVKVVNTGGASGFSWRLWDAAGENELTADQTLALLGSGDGTEGLDAELDVLARRAVDPVWAQLFEDREAARAAVEAFQEALPTTLVSRERSERRMARIQMRGAYDRLGDEVGPATPAILPPLPQDGPADRLALARWVVARDNPLAARVWVNRAWQHFFGRGIVSTPEDFGSQGAWPTHPKLLDWLAVTFMDEGWDMKAMHRRIALSRAYRQSSVLTPERAEIDPDGGLVSRGPRHRLDGEVLRDQALYLAGMLDESMGGPGVRPYQPDGVWFAVGYTRSNTVRYEVGPEADQRRRSLYTFWKRTAPPPNLTTFDAPMRDTCTVQRERTNTPLQALVTLNDPTYVEAAKFIAAGIVGSGARSPEQRAQALFEHVVGHPASDEECAALTGLATELQAEFSADPEAAAGLLGVGMLPLPDAVSALDPAELAAWTLVASTLLNLDEVLTND
ncbi:Planctomycete cytochrome C [Planctomycetes bacterium Poly30]|uniref:Planctomycete cytochrome C n=1 Tax=Saltatorellus ferox TaxID=2528018 RepID=A0A518EMC8_9BACT|nr:Planctomycete cytochrome C [Planctomycetes bacterium Poly30]